MPNTTHEIQEKEYLKSGGIYCPVCKSDDIEGGHIEIDAPSAWQKTTCNSCNIQWNDIYKLVGIERIEQ